MSWVVELADEFEAEFMELPGEVQDELLANAKLLEKFGPMLGRPHADTLNGSRHVNMKELRFDAADGAWRVPSLSFPGEGAYCLWPAIRAAGVKGAFTRS